MTLQTALQKANFLGPQFLNGVHILCRALLQELILNKTEVINMNIGTANVASSRLTVLEKILCGKNKWQLHVNVPGNFHRIRTLSIS